MDEQDFRRLFDMHGGLVWSMIGKFRIPESDARDLFMEIWEAVWKSLPSYGGKSKLSTWIGGIAKMKCIDRRRKRPADIPEEPDTIERLAGSGGDAVRAVLRRAGHSPRAAAIGREALVLIGKAIEGLPPDQKRVTLLWMAGHSYRAIADTMNAAGSDPPDTAWVGKQIYLAKGLIRKALKRAGISGFSDLME